MNALRVKARFCGLTTLVALALSGCSGSATKPVATERVESVRMAAGAEGWSDGALLLPKDSPAVVVARIDRVLDAARRLKAWLTEEPAMLGPDGAQTVRSVQNAWATATAYLGLDPLLERAWVEHGVDPKRPMFLGLYPLRRDGQRFVGAIETTIREEVGLAPGKPITPSLRVLALTAGALPEGTNAHVLRTVGQSHPRGGVRVVIPLASRNEFMTTATSFAEGMGFRPFPRDLSQGRVEHALWSPRGAPAMAIRMTEQHAVLDILFPAFLSGTRAVSDSEIDLPRVFANLESALEDLPLGRPRAPAPPGEPGLAVAFDQEAMAKIVRLRGYHESLESLQSAGTERRDMALLTSLLSAVSEASAWQIGARELTGTTFELSVGSSSSRSIGSVRMTMFGRHELPAVDTSRSVPTLDVGRRTAAVGIDFSTLRDPAWRQWFHADTVTELAALDFEPVPLLNSLLPGARAATLAVSSLGQPGVSALSTDLGETLGELDSVARLELVGLSPDLGDFRQPPEFLCAVVLEQDADPAALQNVQSVFAGVLLGWFHPTDLEALPELVPGTTTSVSMDQLVVHQRLVTGNRDVVIFGVGMDATTFDAEADALRRPRAVSGIVEARLEPVALLSWLRSDDKAILDPLDADILAQRLGAVSLRYQSIRSGHSNGVSVELELHAPPRL